MIRSDEAEIHTRTRHVGPAADHPQKEGRPRRRRERPLARLAEAVAGAWPDADAIDRALQAGLPTVPNCHLLYAWDVNGIERSSMVRAEGRTARGAGAISTTALTSRTTCRSRASCCRRCTCP
ncbi:MAG: hypothetical protein MZU95_10415 [Desulfomicrobium escambiense]|nr:hypothetical protein [Desulfomicrobium escambiense]